MMKTHNRPVGAFIGAFLLKQVFEMMDNARPELHEGTKDWDRECWHWSLHNWGKELDRGDVIKQMPVEDYHLPNGTAKKARVFFLERDCGDVRQIGDRHGGFTVRYKTT